MILLSGRLSKEQANRAWKAFKRYHYDFGTVRQELADNRAAFLAINESGKVIGFAAALSQQGKVRTTKTPYRSHKIVTRPEYQHLWGEVADAIAEGYASSGSPFSCIAPDSLTSYRLNNPNWEKRDNSNLPVGCSSWKYIGAAMTAAGTLAAKWAPIIKNALADSDIETREWLLQGAGEFPIDDSGSVPKPLIDERFWDVFRADRCHNYSYYGVEHKIDCKKGHAYLFNDNSVLSTATFQTDLTRNWYDELCVRDDARNERKLATAKAASKKASV